MIHVPPNAAVAKCQSLDAIRILSMLCAKGGKLEQLKAAVKSALKQKKAQYAESDLVIARLAAPQEKSFVDPRQLYALIESKRITLEQFLDVICVRTSLLPPILSGAEIDAISQKPEARSQEPEDGGSLYTEFKPGVQVDLDAIVEGMLDKCRVKSEECKVKHAPRGDAAKGSECKRRKPAA